MSEPRIIHDDGSTITVLIPFRIRRRGGRKLVIAPDGAGWGAQTPRVDNAMVKALARAFRWRRMIESGEFSTISDLAEAEKVNRSYLCRVLRITLLAPSLVEAILDGTQPVEMSLEGLLQPFPVVWSQQRNSVANSASRESV